MSVLDALSSGDGQRSSVLRLLSGRSLIYLLPSFRASYVAFHLIGRLPPSFALISVEVGAMMEIVNRINRGTTEI